MINATRAVLINNSNIVFAAYRIELPNLITFFAIKLYVWFQMYIHHKDK